MTNRLAQESSPYLQQHKNNPVDWWPYSEKAFEIAAQEDKPVFISIGYSTCHWCHVMARESFSDEDTAAFMNSQFINIKMDREEYPGIDKVYQEMYQMLHQRGGGWPLSVWAFPNGTPFYIGTYFPDEASHGLPSFMEVNRQLVDAWNTKRSLINQQADRLSEAVRSMAKKWVIKEGELTEDHYYKEIIHLQQRFDRQFGGIGSAPKFPRIASFRLLLQEAVRKDLSEVLDFVRFTFHRMAKGGIYDQLGGGFARYSVDREWIVPHFEKMLYDNGGLIELGAEVASVTGDGFAEFIVKETIEWVAREMTAPSGAFYAAMNAESEGQEGKYYVFTSEEFDNVLGEDTELGKSRYGITEEGNFVDPHHPDIHGMNVLTLDKTVGQLADEFEYSENELISKLGSIKKQLLNYRDKREAPSIDTKILTSWNGIMIKGLFRAAELLGMSKAADLAKNALDYLISEHLEEDQLLRTYDKNKNHRVPAILDDYSYLMSSCIAAYEYYDDWSYIETAQRLERLTTEKFFDDKEEVYYLNERESDDLFNGIVQISDDSMASGLGNLIGVLFKLGKYLEDERLIDRGQRLVSKFAGRLSEYPGSMDAMLLSASYYLRYPHEIVIVKAKHTELQNAFFPIFIPTRLVYRWDDENGGRPTWEVLRNRTQVDRPTVFVCKGQTCSLPLYTAEDVQEELNRD